MALLRTILRDGSASSSPDDQANCTDVDRSECPGLEGAHGGDSPCVEETGPLRDEEAPARRASRDVDDDGDQPDHQSSTLGSAQRSGRSARIGSAKHGSRSRFRHKTSVNARYVEERNTSEDRIGVESNHRDYAISQTAAMTTTSRRRVKVSSASSRARPRSARSKEAAPNGDRLQQKYLELKQMLEETYVDHRRDLNRHVTRQARSLMRQYQMTQEGLVAPAAHPGPPQALLVRDRAGLALERQTSSGTQTQTEARRIRAAGDTWAEGDEGMLLIDTTDPQTTSRHVTFADDSGTNDHSDDADTAHFLGHQGRIHDDETNCGVLGSFDVSPQRATTTPRCQSARISRTKGRRRRGRNKLQAKSSSGLTRSCSDHEDDDVSTSCSSLSPSPRRQLGESESSCSESSPSRSRSREDVTQRHSDHTLKTTSNPKIKQWLKEKNRLLRQQKRVERKKRKQEKLEAEKAQKEKEDAKILSQEKVKLWMAQKGKENRLLTKRERKKSTTESRSGDFQQSESVVVDETVDLQSGEVMEVVDGNENAAEPLSSSHETNGSRPENPASGDENVSAETHHSCTCGYVDRMKKKDMGGGDNETNNHDTSKDESAKGSRSRARPKYKPRPPNAKKSEHPPRKSRTVKVIEGNAQGDSHVAAESADLEFAESEVPSRESYDVWLKKKRKESLRKKKRERRQKAAEGAARSDPETTDLVSAEARRRMDNILKNRKRVDTGIREIDEMSNQTLEDKCQTKTFRSKSRERPSTATSSKDTGDERAPSLKDTGVERAPSLKDTGVERARYKLRAPEQRRPVSATPVTYQAPPTSGMTRRPLSAQPLSLTVNKANNIHDNNAFNPFRGTRTLPVRAKSPKPPTKVTAPYKKVKYQRRSWDQFSDYVWDKLNGEEPPEDKAVDALGVIGESKGLQQRPEPQGADSPDLTSFGEAHIVQGKANAPLDCSTKTTDVREGNHPPDSKTRPERTRDVDVTAGDVTAQEDVTNTDERQSDESDDATSKSGSQGDDEDIASDKVSDAAGEEQDAIQTEKDESSPTTSPGPEDRPSLRIDDSFIAELRSQVDSLMGYTSQKDTDIRAEDANVVRAEQTAVDLNQNDMEPKPPSEPLTERTPGLSPGEQTLNPIQTLRGDLIQSPPTVITSQDQAVSEVSDVSCPESIEEEVEEQLDEVLEDLDDEVRNDHNTEVRNDVQVDRQAEVRCDQDVDGCPQDDYHENSKQAVGHSDEALPTDNDPEVGNTRHVMPAHEEATGDLVLAEPGPEMEGDGAPKADFLHTLLAESTAEEGEEQRAAVGALETVVEEEEVSQ